MEQRTAELLILNEQLERQIAEVKRTEEQLKESERRYRVLTDSSLTGIYIHQNGRFTFVNERLARMLGYSPEEMLGESIWKFVYPDDKERIMETLRERVTAECGRSTIRIPSKMQRWKPQMGHGPSH